MSGNFENSYFIHLEEKSLNAWPALKTLLYKGCIVRLSNGYTKRANCANLLYIKQKDIDSIVDFVTRIYKTSNLPVIFKILDIENYKLIDFKLEKLGYKKIDTTNIMRLDLSKYDLKRDVGVEIGSDFSKEWLDAYFKMKNRKDMDKDTAVKMLNNISTKLVVVSIKEYNKIVACGYGICEDGYIGLFDIMVDANYRGRGFGKSLVSGILSKAKEIDMKFAYLQVVTQNLVAVNMYENIGFKKIYSYWYRYK